VRGRHPKVKRPAPQPVLDSQPLVQEIIDSVVSVICVLDPAGRIVAVNRAWRELYADDRVDWSIGADYLQLCHSERGPYGDAARGMVAGIRDVMGGARESFVLEYPCHRVPEPCWYIARVMRCKDGSGNLVVTHENVTLHKMAEDRIILASSVFACAGEGITICNAAREIIDVNDSFTRITGYRRDEVLGRNPSIFKSGRQGPDFYAAMWRALDQEDFWRGEIWNRHKSGRVYAEMLTISVVRDQRGGVKNYVALFADITAEKEHARQIEHIAHFDALTGLPNRALLGDRLNQAIRRGQRNGKALAVVYLDLDGFKEVNDRHGHVFGDELLIAISQRMKLALRDGDTLARIGGDEFVAVLGDLEQPQECEPVLARLLRAAADPVALGNRVMTLSASIGVTIYPDDGADADLLLRHADQAMVVAKQAGRNRYHLFDVAHDAAVIAQRETLQDIRRALDRGEFLLHYQPKVNMKTGKVEGLEALIRWRHPERGLLAPAEFLPAVENSPLSIELGDWVIETTLRQIDRWRDIGVRLPVSVNIGAKQLQQADFVERLRRQLAAHPEVQPKWLELEILETSALEDMAMVSEHLAACRELGVACALDDFGTGYSSLAYLRRLPAESIKIDQSFVRDMLEDDDDLRIVEGVVGLARAFKRRIIAEGVETAAHGELLLSLGCELAQGFGIARPMAAEEIPGWVANWRPDPLWRA
jgi:diguanylate cyclase (GGDEF)-like protein/PAS domain S-box-containing protein